MPSQATEIRLLLKKKLSHRGVPIPYSDLNPGLTPVPSPCLALRQNARGGDMSPNGPPSPPSPLPAALELRLKYMYLYFDQEIGSSGDEPGQQTEETTYRHSLAHFTEFYLIKDLDISALEQAKFPFMQTVFDTYGQSTVFYHVQVHLDVPAFFSQGSFKNLTLLTASLPLSLHCSTIVLSFGKRVLETEEVQDPVVKDGKISWPVQLVNGFFTAFFNGFKGLESESEARAAISNLGVVQVIRQANLDGQSIDAHPPLVCISYEFIPSSGQVDSGTEEIFRLRDLGLMD